MGFIPLVFGVAVVLAQPEQTAEEDFRLQVRRLVEQLKSDRFDQRESARAELITLGPAVLPHLPKIHAGTDSELREAISKVRSALEVEAARNSLNARRVNLDVTDKPLLQVLNDITRQTGNPIIDFRGFRGQPKTSPPVTVHWKDVPFWKAVDEVLAKAGMAVYPYAIDREGAPLRAVAFVDRAGQAAGDDKVVAYEGAFRFEPLQVIARRGLRDPLQSGLEVTMEVAWEPRLVPISLKVLYDSLSAVDDTDQQLVLVAAGEREIEMNGGSVGTFPVRFKLPRQSAVKVKMMSGKIEGLIPGGQETFTFNKLTTAKNQQQQKAGATVILEGVRNLGAADDNIEEDGIEEDGIEEDGFGEDDLQADDLPDDDEGDGIGDPQRSGGTIWEVRVRVQFQSAGEALESHLMHWVTENEAHLIDAKGKKVEWSTIEKTREVDDEFGVAYLFGLDDDIANYTFEYKTPVALLKRQIPFQLEEISLP